MLHRLRALALPFAFALAAASLLAPAPAAAQEAEAYAPPALLTEEPRLPEAMQDAPVWRLDLKAAIQTAVRQNLGLVVSRESVRVADLGIEVASGAFEPRVTASYSHSEVDTPPVDADQGDAGDILTNIDDSWNLGVSQRLPTGGLLRLDFTNSRSDSNSRNAFPLSYRSQLTAGITQPLLRGFSFDLDIPRVDVLKAKIGSERQRADLVIQVMDVVQRTEVAYWDVVSALKTYQVQLLAFDRARQQLELTQRQIDAGVLAPSDLISAESTLAQRRLQLVQAEARIEQTWDSLRQILNLPRDDWKKAIVPVDLPTFAPRVLSTDEALAAALAHRPEIRQQDLDLERSALSVREAENNRLPQIDLGLTYTTTGQDDGYRPALDQLAGLEAPGWTVLISLTWTPLGRATGASAEIERANLRIARAQREERVLLLYAEVRDAVRNLDTAAREVQAAARFRKLAEKSLDVEERKFLNGTSSNFLVAQRQEEVARAQLSELSAVISHKRAELALERATGRLLESRQIVLE